MSTNSIPTPWERKLIALLHDPPDKVLSLEGHRARAAKLIELILGQARFNELFGTEAATLNRAQFDAFLKNHSIIQADHIATAMDRAAFPGAEKTQVKSSAYVQKPMVRHPLGGRPLGFVSMDAQDELNKIEGAVSKVIASSSKVSTDELRYLWAWRCLRAEIGEQLSGELRELWPLLPADTRICDHALEQHLDATAAVVSALPQPALLVFNLGGVQDFIATARRTQDLWMGSYILSYLAWQGMRVIAKRFGPDAVLYPSLRGQPLVDHWLSQLDSTIAMPPNVDKLKIATLPNKFVALVPAEQIETLTNNLANEVKATIGNAWKDLTKKVRNELAELLDDGQPQKIRSDETWNKMWEQHSCQFPQVYWCAHVWPNTKDFPENKQYTATDAALQEIRGLLNLPPDWPFEEIYRIYGATEETKRIVNVGTVYGPLHHLAQHGLDARKVLRDFPPINEEGPKCTVCGVRAALCTTTDSAEGTKGLWSKLSEKLRDADEQRATDIQRKFSGHYAAIKPDGRERLCGICATKRLVQPAAFNDELGLKSGFPSTSTVSAASFVTALFRELGSPDPKLTEFKKTFGAFVQALKDARLPETAAERAIPLNSDLTGQVTNDIKWAASQLIKYDGDFLFLETYNIERLQEDYAWKKEDDVKKIKRELDKLRGRLRDLYDQWNDWLRSNEHSKHHLPRRAAKYYAILMLDGDQMRKWVSGVLAPRFAQTLHPLAAEGLAHFSADWAKWLDHQRVLSPALHTSVSHALANFALKCVKWVVEDCYPGRVVYAGGDDMLALLPVDCALAAARELRALFSGEAIRQDEKLQDEKLVVRFADPDCTGFLKWENDWLLTMGPTASASVGIAIAHHLQPLDAALEAARRAVESAKEDYGRNAIAIHFLRRSGEELRIGAHFFYGLPNDPSRPPMDTLYWIDQVRQRMAEGKLSFKLAHDFFEQARALAESPEEAVQAILIRALMRHKGEQLTPEEAKKQPKELGPRLAQLATALDEPRRRWKQEHREEKEKQDGMEELQSGVTELANWLLLARFLAQGGGED